MPLKLIAIDPGPTESAFVTWDGSELGPFDIAGNEQVLQMINGFKDPDVPLVIEQVASYGMPVGADIFETVFWSGRFAQAFDGEVFRVPRLRVKMHVCHDSRAKDSNIRQALIDRFGKPGTKKDPGLTYGLKKDLWAAFALAVYSYDTGLKQC